MSKPVHCFMLRETSSANRSFRRYSNKPGKAAPCKHYHNAMRFIERVDSLVRDADGYWPAVPREAIPPLSDPRWPTKCDHCDYVFKLDDPMQVFDEHLYRTDTGQEMTLREAPPGAMWYADWMGEEFAGPDGHCLMVRCPDGHDWMIDGYASNCTMKNDRGPWKEHHRCWVRHGTPPLITVDKNGRTCAAGAGSIATKGYHGFLRDGTFTAG